MRLSRALALITLVLLLGDAVPAAAQGPPRPDKNRRGQVLDRLRRPPADSAAQRTDTLAAAARADTLPVVAPVLSDSVMKLLMTLQGYHATEYQGAAVSFTADSSIVGLSGKAQVSRAGQAMSADSLLVYDLDTSIVCGYGNPVMSGSGASPVRSQQVCYDIERGIGRASGAATQFTEMGTWYVEGEEVYPVGGDRIYAHDARFTDCDLEVPHYHFAAETMKIVNDDVLVARDVTLNFRGVPVFWLPFMMQSMKQGRRSGLLTPQFGVNDIARTSSGYQRRISNVGFYWAISEHLGAEAALDWYSGNYTGVSGTFQYRWLRQFLDGGVTFRQFWKEAGGTEITASSSNRWQPTERTSISATGQYTSSSDFVRRQTFNPLELNRSIDSNASLNHRFDWGSVSIGAQRRQFLSDDKTELKLPSVSLTLQPVTLFESMAADPSWYQNSTWTGSANFALYGTDLPETLPGANLRDQDARTGSVTSQFNMGSLAWSQQLDFNEAILQPKPAVDSVAPLALSEDQRMTWSSSLNYQQRLFGTTTFTPGVTLRGGSRRSTELGSATLTAPMKWDLNATLRTDVFGFWPGMGSYTRIRHRLSPSVSYSYSPEVTADSLQRVAFQGMAVDTREQNRLSLNLSQTFEAKVEAEDSVTNPAEPQVEEAVGDGPRRLPQVQKLTLLSLNTSAIVYDFVRAREDTLGNRIPGLETTSLNNSISSDLLRGLSISVSHDLFELGPGAGTATTLRRTRFAPHLSNVTANFSLSNDSWILRLLGLGRGREVGPELPGPDTSANASAQIGQTPAVPGGAGLGMMEEGGQRQNEPVRRGSVGTWNAQFGYTLIRPRAAQLPTTGALNPATSTENQMLRANVSMQPTEKWNLAWNTSYSLTDGAFADHILTLTRDLHEWQANFDFVKAQNGNFSFQFRVQLRAAPDLKVEYEQRGQRDFP